MASGFSSECQQLIRLRCVVERGPTVSRRKCLLKISPTTVCDINLLDQTVRRYAAFERRSKIEIREKEPRECFGTIFFSSCDSIESVSFDLYFKFVESASAFCETTRLDFTALKSPTRGSNRGNSLFFFVGIWSNDQEQGTRFCLVPL